MTNEQKIARLAELEQALFSGVAKVKNNDKEITYNSPDEIRKAIGLLKRELGLSKKPKKRILMSHSKGLDE